MGDNGFRTARALLLQYVPISFVARVRRKFFRVCLELGIDVVGINDDRIICIGDGHIK